MLSIKMPKNQEITPGKYAGNISGKNTKRNNENILPHTAGINAFAQLDGIEKKKILVTGMYPYVGRAFACFMCRWPDRYRTDLTGIKRKVLKETDFSGYDAVLYTGMAGSCKEFSEKYTKLYKKDAIRAARTAGLAKKAGVNMFVYLSSLHVYETGLQMITEKTPVCPSDARGEAELYAEKALWELRDDTFHAALVRIPPVYGHGLGGCYRWSVRFAVRYGVFPEFGRKRSMIHIDNLSSAVRGIICSGESGICFPQDAVCAGAYEMAAAAAEFHGRRLKGTKLCNPLLRQLAKRSLDVNEMFYGYLCDQSLNVPAEWIEVKSLEEAVRKAESGW